MATTNEATRTETGPSASVYDAFISYSHAADDLLAPRLQAGLQRFAKPWWKRRALRVFRDEASLSANPHLWSSITEALDTSGWFLLLLSPDAAESPWVNNEITYWRENYDSDRIIPVLTDGEFSWDGGDVAGDAVPAALSGAFEDEPRWVDVRFAKGDEQLDLKNPQFSSAIADLAAPLRGIPKDELQSEEVKQHRRTIRIAWAAGVLVAALGVAAVVFGIQSADNARLAEENAAAASANAAAEAEQRAIAQENEQLAESRGLASSAISVLADDPELSTLLALRAIDRTPTSREPPLEAVNALWRAASSNRLVDVYDSEAFTTVDLSADGTRLAAAVGPQELRMLDAATGEILWSYSEETVDYFDLVDISVDGRVALGILDSRSPNVPVPFETDATDDLPNRIVILDPGDGSLIQTLTYEDCLSVTVPAWSPDGRFLAVSSGVARSDRDISGCDRGDGASWAEVLDTGNWEVAALLRGGTVDGPTPRWDETGALHLFTADEPTRSFEPLTFEERSASGASGHGDVSPNAAFYLMDSSSAGVGTFNSVYLFDAETGNPLDILYNEGDFPHHQAIRFSPDGSVAIVGTRGRYTFVYDLPSTELAHKLAAGPTSSVAYDRFTGRLYTSGSEPGIEVWDLEGSSVSIDQTIDLGEFTRVNGNSFKVGPDAVAVDPANPVDFAWKVLLFDPATGELVAESPEDMAAPQPLPDGRWVTSSVSTPPPMVWDPETGQAVELVGCEVVVEDDRGNQGCGGENEPWGYDFIVTPGGDRILVYGRDYNFGYTGHFRVFDAATGALLDSAEPGQDPGPADPFALRPSGWNPASTVHGDGWVLGWNIRRTFAYDLATGNILYSGGIGVNEAAPDLDLLAAASGRQVSILDTSTDGPWAEIATIPTDDRVRGLAFNPEGSKLAIGDVSGLYVIDTSTWQVVQQVKLPDVSDIYWIDDETVLVGTATGLFGTMSLSTDRLLADVRAGLLRSFTDQECRTYRIDPCPTLDEMKDG